MKELEKFPIEYKFVHGRTGCVMTPSEDPDRTFFFCAVICVLEHQLHVRINDEHIILFEGESIIIPEQIRHDIWVTGRPSKQSFSYFTCRFASMDVLKCIKRPYLILRDPLVPELVARINEGAAFPHIYGKLNCDAAIAGLVSRVLLECGSTKESPYVEKWLSDVLSYINNNIGRPIFSDELIEVSGYAKTAFYNHFLQVMGVTPNAYILSQKMQAACAYLSQGLSVSETAEKVGFVDKMYFSRVFKSHVGIMPSAYKKEYGI